MRAELGKRIAERHQTAGLSYALACTIALGTAQRASAQSGIIRDAEIEGLLRLYAVPILRAAGLSPSAVRVYIIRSDTLNAFVANGQRIFVHTGMLTRTKVPERAYRCAGA